MTKVLSLDPASITGYALIDTPMEMVSSGSGSLPEVRGWLFELAGAGVNPDLIMIELGYDGKNSQSEERNVAQKEKSDIRIGYYMGICGVLFPEATVVRLRASEWRAILRRNGYDMPQQPRSECKDAALRIAREILGVPCVGPRGGRKEDEADACCIALAGLLRGRKA